MPDAAAPPLRYSPRVLISLTLSVVGGFCDVICLVRYRVFAATLTGNLIFVGRTVFEWQWHLAGRGNPLRNDPFQDIDGDGDRPDDNEAEGLLYRFAVVLANCAGVALFCELQRRVGANSVSKLAPLLSVMLLAGDGARFLFGRWCVLSVAASLGASHFLSGPSSNGSRLKAVTMAGTTHLHKVTKLMWKRSVGGASAVKDEEWRAGAQSATIACGLVLGALLGAVVLHVNPLTNLLDPNDDGTSCCFIMAAAVQFVALRAHDAQRLSEVPAGLQPLAEPLVAAEEAGSAGGGGGGGGIGKVGAGAGAAGSGSDDGDRRYRSSAGRVQWCSVQ